MAGFHSRMSVKTLSLKIKSFTPCKSLISSLVNETTINLNMLDPFSSRPAPINGITADNLMHVCYHVECVLALLKCAC